VIRTYVRLCVAALVATIPTLVIASLVRRAAGVGSLGSLLAVVVTAPVTLVSFGWLIRRMRVRELDQLLTMVPGLRRRTG
jgi:hypothetical protein